MSLPIVVRCSACKQRLGNCPSTSPLHASYAPVVTLQSPDERLMLALNKGRIDVIKAVLHDIPDMKFAPPAEFYDGADNEKINRRDRNLERRIKSQQSQEMMQSLKEKITPDQMSRIDDIMMWDSPRKERKDAFRQMTFEEAVDKIVGLDKLSDPERGYLKVRSALLEEKFDIIDAREALEDKWHSLEYKEALPDGWLLVWAMHMAAANGDVELVQELLHRVSVGSSVNHVGTNE